MTLYSKSLKRLQQAQRADELLTLSREQRLEAVGVKPKPVVKPVFVKLKRLSVESVRSLSSQTDEGTASRDREMSHTEHCDGLDSVNAKDVGVMAGVDCGGGSQCDRSSKMGADGAAVDVVVRCTSKKSRKRKTAAEQTRGEAAISAESIPLHKGVSVMNDVDCGSNSQSDSRSSNMAADREAASATGQMDVVMGRVSKKSRKHKAVAEHDREAASATGQMDLVVGRVSKKSRKHKAVAEHSRGKAAATNEECCEKSRESLLQSNVLPTVSETVLPPSQYRDIPETNGSLCHDYMMTSVSSNLNLNGNVEKGDIVELPGTETEQFEDETMTLTAVSCGIAATSATVAESQQLNNSRVTTCSTLESQHQENVMGDGATAGGQKDGIWNRRSCGRKRYYMPRGMSQIRNDLTTDPGLDNTGDRGQVRRRRGRPCGSRRARGVHGSFYSPLHHDVWGHHNAPQGTSWDTGANNVTSSACTISSAVSGPVLYEDLPAAGYTGETKHGSHNLASLIIILYPHSSSVSFNIVVTNFQTTSHEVFLLVHNQVIAWNWTQ